VTLPRQSPSRRHRLLPPLVGVFVVSAVMAAGGTWVASARAETQARPFLWKVEQEGHPAAWLFGTIHVPDARVQAMPPAVAAAFAAADRVVTEIPLDLDAQLAVAQALVLPPDQHLRQLIGEARFARLASVIRGALDDEAPAVSLVVLAALDRLKPWAAMTQLALVEYLPDLLDGRPSLDARLFADAREAGKQLSALETVDEQARVFEVFTLDEQLALLDTALAQAEAGSRADAQPGRVLVDRYLTGDAARLHAAVDEQAPPDPALARKFEQVLLHDRNRRMVERFEALRAAHPNDVMFVAIGTLHLVGEVSVPSLLEARGYRVARVTSAGN
jgi:uncharacterized protein YbaP (TraB family)